MTVSVIIPAFNRVDFLKKAIESVLSQTYKDFELIIIDDGSEDDTPEMVSGFKDKIVYIKQKRQGPAAARNAGIKASKGRYIAFLDSDDWWDKEKLSIQVNEMDKNPNYAVSHTEEKWYKDGKIFNQKRVHKKFHGYIFDKCLPLCVVSMSTALIKRELFNDTGLFDESLPCCEDYDFWLRVSARYPLLLIDKPLTLKDGGRKDQVSYIYRTGMDKFRIGSITKILDMPKFLNGKQRKLAKRELAKKCRIYGNGCIKHNKPEEGAHYLSLPERY
ncbi:MAG TPA: glycosyltransferase family 2 protein [Candidatus Omnitrophica bacterium]|nr:glycosyltransferase family 2 protein [Candidatus Omnitrophota bacterium]